jgi:hypothetical protein
MLLVVMDLIVVQIEGPTQTNPFGLKNIPVDTSTDSTRERQDMNAFSLEIFGVYFLRLYSEYIETLHLQRRTVATESPIRMWMRSPQYFGAFKALIMGVL